MRPCAATPRCQERSVPPSSTGQRIPLRPSTQTVPAPARQRAPTPSAAPAVSHNFARVGLQASPLPSFGIVRDLAPTGSLSEAEWDAPGRTNLERFADIARLAGADAFLGGSAPINLAGKVPGGTLKPGLNYASELRSKFPDAPAGETGYLDSSDVYHNPDLPAERDGAPPRIVIVLGPNAFTSGKARALSTLRHEMEHAKHEQLALRWLTRWRADRTTASFKDWLGEQVRAKQLSA